MCHTFTKDSTNLKSNWVFQIGYIKGLENLWICEFSDKLKISEMEFTTHKLELRVIEENNYKEKQNNVELAVSFRVKNYWNIRFLLRN